MKNWGNLFALCTSLKVNPGCHFYVNFQVTIVFFFLHTTVSIDSLSITGRKGVPNVSAIATSMLSWAGILLKYSTKWKKQKNKKTYKAFKSTPYYACSVVKLPRNMSGCQSLSRQLALQCSRNSSKGIKLNQLENFGPCHTSSSPSKPDRYINIKKKKRQSNCKMSMVETVYKEPFIRIATISMGEFVLCNLLNR